MIRGRTRFATIVRLMAVATLVLAAGCGTESPTSTQTSQSSSSVVPEQSPTALIESTTSTLADDDAKDFESPSRTVITGAERLVTSGFAQIDGRRVGLISHQNSVVDGVHLADHLAGADNVELVALFGPEHGARGDRDAGEFVEDMVDVSTGTQVFSLFGDTRQPTPAMLQDIDVLLYDLQDVGARYYTYISTMGLAMQAAALADIDFIVLDRPNPLGGRVAGGVLEPESVSFVGQYPIPDVYGLTAGELALAIQAEAWLDGLDDLDLSVIEMIGWDASMLWGDTGLDWIPPSPALVSPDAALLYPATVYLEATSLSYGRGTDRPFQSFGAPWLDALRAADELSSRHLPGLAFTTSTVTPRLLPGMTVTPAFVDTEIDFVDITVTEPTLFRPVETGIHILDVVFAETQRIGEDVLSRPQWLDQLSGSETLRLELVGGQPVDRILERVAAEGTAAATALTAHHLYQRP